MIARDAVPALVRLLCESCGERWRDYPAGLFEFHTCPCCGSDSVLVAGVASDDKGVAA